MEMKVSELRIGNLVSCQINENYKITGEVYNIQRSTIRCYVDNELEEILVDNGRFHPIPLTEEWLIKFGFKLSGHNKDSGYKSYTLYSKGFHIMFCIECNHSPECYIESIGIDINHVHQLQNLYFALTGEGLEVK